MTVERANWMQLAFQWRGSVASKVFFRILLCGGLGFIISLFDYFGFSLSWQGFNTIITNVSYNLVLGLLLVFRTNSAYDRFWEGRKAWGTITASIRSLGHFIWVAIAESEPQDRADKVSALRLLVAFAITTKLKLRRKPINSELKSLITQEQLLQLQSVQSTSLQLSIWIGNYLQKQYERKLLSVNQLTAMNGLVNDMLGGFTTCERILSTPIPLAYAIYLKRLLLIYCISLPFQVVNTLHWWTSPIVIILSFVLLGVEEIGTEIENPFGEDANDLPLEEICANISQDIEDLIRVNSQEPS